MLSVEQLNNLGFCIGELSKCMGYLEGGNAILSNKVPDSDLSILSCTDEVQLLGLKNHPQDYSTAMAL